jgi:hypothetical protein
MDKGCDALSLILVIYLNFKQKFLTWSTSPRIKRLGLPNAVPLWAQRLSEEWHAFAKGTVTNLAPLGARPSQ